MLTEKFGSRRSKRTAAFVPRSKGISFSLNLIVILAISILVLVALGVFFASGSFGQISHAEAQRIFAGGCSHYCTSSLYDTFSNAYQASQNDPNFVKACTALGYGNQQHVNWCLEKCSNCNLKVTQSDLNQGLDNLNSLTTR